jgi:hypothetical protein
MKLFRCFLTVLLCLLVPYAAAQEPTPAESTPAEAALMAEILELQRRLDELLAQLPPHLRERLAAEASEMASAPPPVVAPPAVEATSPRPQRRRRRVCNTLLAFDSNGDGKVDATDRYWRYLYLWTDRNRDGRVEEREIVLPFDKKVREIAVHLETFQKKKGLGEIRLGENILLDMKGDGFGGADDTVLVVDAMALGRRDGPRLVGADGNVLEGYVAFRDGLSLRDAVGTVTELNCP